MITTHVFLPQNRLFSAIAAPELLYHIDEKLDHGAKHVVIDLRNVVFMDSSGLGALVIARNRTQKSECRLSLCSLSGQARMLFEMAELEPMFEIFVDLEALKQALPENNCLLISVGEFNRISSL